MNLSTAKASNRSKEIGISKVVGSSKSQLVQQFLLESIVTSMISLFLAVVLVMAILPAFNTISGKFISFYILVNWNSVPALIGFAIMVGFIAGSYPAFLLASFNPISAIQGKISMGMKTGSLRSILVVGQFAISIILIAGTLIVYKQLDFMQNKNLGFNKEQIVVLHRAFSLGDQFESFRQEIQNHSNIISASGSTGLPSLSANNYALYPGDGTRQDVRPVWQISANINFVETMEMELIAGRNFSEEFSTDSTAVLINQVIVKQLNWQDDPIGKRLGAPGPGDVGTDRFFTVIGVVKDFNFQSLRQEVRPLMISGNLLFGQSFGYLSVRIGQNNIPETVAYLEEMWKTYAPNSVFEYTFLDQDFDNLYRSEMRLSRIFSIFTFLAIFVAALGLFGLSSYAATQRKKEIGIRKVLGASVSTIVIMMSKEFTKLIAIAFVIGFPIAYFLVDRWLQDFAYRISIGFEVFAITALIAVFIAIITVSYQSIRAAYTNPVNVIHYE